MFDKYIIVEARDYDSALKKGLKDKKIKKEDVIVEVLEERKGYMLRKPYIKLKITPKQKKTDDILLYEANKLNNEIELEKLISEDKKFFQINFLSDGVYITLTEDLLINNDIKLNKITKYLEKKSVEDYDKEIIKKIIEEKNHKPHKIASYQKEKLIDGDANIEISEDKLKVYITLIEAEGGVEVTTDDIHKKLKEKGIVYGLDNDKILNAIEKKLYNKKILIANGKTPEDGKDAEVIYHFSKEKSQKPKLLKDGSVDFKELDLINNVDKGQLLIEIIPPTDGKPGVDVFGNEIPNKKGNYINIIKGPNVVEKENEFKIYATADGQVIFKDGKIEVKEIYEIAGDVDTSTGNIKFNGNVIVRGNVKSGFRVEAEGDIQVNGVVEGSVLIAKGDIVLSRGIQGNNQGFVKAGGDFKARYIENSEVKCDGNVEADVILHSDVVAGSNVIVLGKKGLIAGGSIKSGEEIRAKTIGSHMGTATNLEVGIDPDERKEYDKIEEEIKEIQKNLSNLTKTINLLERLKKESRLPKDKEEILIKSENTKLYLQEKQMELINKSNDFKNRIENLSKGKIHVSGTIYPGVKITILNAIRHIYDEIVYSTLYREDGEIVIGPYEK